jgi:nucleoside-diphosphate-sugar epimerase
MTPQPCENSRILIAGCGYVGAALGVRLATMGHTVCGLRRDPSSLPTAITPIRADLSHPETLRDLPDALDTVFYTAGAVARSDGAYRMAYVDGLRHLFEVLVALPTPPRRVIFTSSTAVYAQTDGSWVDETSPTEPTSFSGRRLLEAEALLGDRPFETVTLRLGGIYGPGRTGLIDRVRRGEARRERDATRYINLIHLEDIVDALIHLMKLDRPAPVYLGVDSEPQEYTELVEWIAGTLGSPLPPSTGEVQTLGQPLQNRRCSNARLSASGFTFTYPSARAGYAELMANMSPQGPIAGY